MLDTRDMIQSFNAAAHSYAAASKLQKYAGQQLLDRLELVRLTPLSILDLGSGPGISARALAKKYPAAGVIELDIAENMLKMSRNNTRGFFSRHKYVCADADNIPLADQSVDMVFSNLMMQWSQYPDRLFANLRRIVRPHGLVMFTSLGPDTLRELRESWARADDRVHVNTFIDMHDLGDALVRAGFSDPVMEVELVKLTYGSLDLLMQDLRGLGAHNVHRERRRTLTGKQRFGQMRTEYEKRMENGKLPATYELIYGHAWVGGGTAPQERRDSGLFSISLDRVRSALAKSRRDKNDK